MNKISMFLKVKNKIIHVKNIFFTSLNFFYHKFIRKISPPKLSIENDKILIHLGCGPIDLEGYINVDTIPYAHVHHVQDVSNLNVFPDEYADLIYACHVLEHISHIETVKILKEWRRVLKNGGILRLSVPDFDKLLDIYFLENRNIISIIGPLMGGQDNIYNYHKAVFNEKYLIELLKVVGFKNIRHWTPNEVHLIKRVEDWSTKLYEFNSKKHYISLNLEAIK